MTPEELREAEHHYPPFDEPIDLVPVSYRALEDIRWLLMHGTRFPEERISAIELLDDVLDRHLRHCSRHTRRPTGL